MTNRWGSFAFGAVLVALISASSAAQRYAGLVGVDSVRVSIAMGAGGVKAYIDSVAMRTTVELDLRRAGLIVIEPGTSYVGPTLILSLDVMPVGSAADASDLLGYNYDLIMQLVEPAVVERGFRPSILAGTWIDSMLGTATRDGNLSDRLRSAAQELTDSFLNAYLAANPRRR